MTTDDEIEIYADQYVLDELARLSMHHAHLRRATVSHPGSFHMAGRNEAR
jgi:hypothetical protein